MEKVRFKDLVRESRLRPLEINFFVSAKEYYIQIAKQTEGPDNRVLKNIYSKKKKRAFKEAMQFIKKIETKN